MINPLAKQLGLKGYWIRGNGSLSVTFHIPSLGERFWMALYDGWSWVPYD